MLSTETEATTGCFNHSARIVQPRCDLPNFVSSSGSHAEPGVDVAVVCFWILATVAVRDNSLSEYLVMGETWSTLTRRGPQTSYAAMKIVAADVVTEVKSHAGTPIYLRHQGEWMEKIDNMGTFDVYKQ
ncbi:hypothetical protein RRG08_038317 [Elysia crispata]|uniref:Uncharacterized protein n=1 Tax=Elysia crispata TaxID=231223 RepID=A0AAE1AQ91_9GAST|nr:hypothetical protein RRG08_038317 [Elysia crispata]